MNRELSKPKGWLDKLIGQRLAERRTALGLSVEDVASRTGTSPESLGDIEAGTTQLSATLMYDLAFILDVDIAYFFSESTEPRPDGKTAGPPKQ